MLALISLVRTAIPGRPSTRAGMMIRVSKNPPHPELGRRSSQITNISISKGAVNRAGTDRKNRVTLTITGSIQRP